MLISKSTQVLTTTIPIVMQVVQMYSSVILLYILKVKGCEDINFVLWSYMNTQVFCSFGYFTERGVNALLAGFAVNRAQLKKVNAYLRHNVTFSH